jgi:hypothetical protein
MQRRGARLICNLRHKGGAYSGRSVGGSAAGAQVVAAMTTVAVGWGAGVA